METDLIGLDNISQQNKIGNERFQQSLKIVNEYIDRYNSRAKSKQSIEVLANFSQAHIEIERLSKELKTKINVSINHVRSFVTKHEKEALNAGKTSDTINMFLGWTFPFTGYFSMYESTSEELISLIERYCIESKTQINSFITDQVKLAFRQKEQLETLIIHKESLELTIERILLDNYPQSLTSLTDHQLQNEIEKRGRPFDPSAPQNKIKSFIKTLIDKAKSGDEKFKEFWHFDGAYQNKPNKKALVSRLLKETQLVGLLSKSTIKERVSKAVSDLGY